jgi:hypothetical protein
VLVGDFDSQQFQVHRQKGAFAMLRHVKHFLHVLNLTVYDLFASCVDQSQEVAFGQWVLFACLCQHY